MKAPNQFCEPRRGGLIFRLLVIIAVLALLGAAAWVVLLPSIVVSTIHSKTGFTVKINQLSVNPLAGTVHVTGLILQNPDDWPEKDFVEVRNFSADTKVMSLFSSHYEADEVTLDIAHVVLVKDKSGKLNATVFSDGLSGGSGSSGPKTEPAKKTSFMIKRLALKFDRMTLVDYSGGGKPVTREYKVGIDEHLQNVDSVTKLMAPFANTTIALLNDALGGRLKLDPGVLQNITDKLKGTGKKAEESFKGLLDSLEKKKP